MFVSPQARETAEYRNLVATAAALVCCAVGLIALFLLLAASDRFEFRPAPETVTIDDNLVRSFDALDEMTAKAATKSPVPGTVGAHKQPAGSEPERKPAGVSSPDIKLPKKRAATRLKSPWCTGVLAHQPFHSCKPRPR